MCTVFHRKFASVTCMELVCLIHFRHRRFSPPNCLQRKHEHNYYFLSLFSVYPSSGAYIPPLTLYPLTIRKYGKKIQAYKLGMYGADYVWILHEIFGEPWWHKTTYECSQKQLQEVSENLLIVSSHNSIVSNEVSYSGLVSVQQNL